MRHVDWSEFDFRAEQLEERIADVFVDPEVYYLPGVFRALLNEAKVRGVQLPPTLWPHLISVVLEADEQKFLDLIGQLTVHEPEGCDLAPIVPMVNGVFGAPDLLALIIQSRRQISLATTRLHLLAKTDPASPEIDYLLQVLGVAGNGMQIADENLCAAIILLAQEPERLQSQEHLLRVTVQSLKWNDMRVPRSVPKLLDHIREVVWY
jgi:hypothetical protein